MDDEFSFSAPRDNLVRHVEFRSEPSDDGLTLEGYAAVFNDQISIDSWEGKFRERMLPGSFAKTLSERTPVMMFNHGKHPMIGDIPIGKITTLREDQNGLFVRARLSDNWLVQPVRDAIKDGAVTGMSVRMRVVQDKWNQGSDRTPERSITEVDVRELGPVVFPAYGNTAVSVRSREVFTALSDPEVRADFARLLAMGTDLEPAVRSENEPGSSHSIRSHSRRRALLIDLEMEESTK